MGRRRRATIAAWAEELVATQGESVARIIGIAPPLPVVTIDVSPARGVASTWGTTITLHEPWFVAHPDDAGCVLHELSHAFLRAPIYDATTAWLIEGIADHTRDVLGFDAPWTFARFEPGGATAGYQATAHFLAWLEERHPDAVARLSRRLAAGTYDEGTFAEIGEGPLTELVAAYEAANRPTGSPP